jgi:CheY-like chemotaxis protein
MRGLLIAETDRDLCDLYDRLFTHHGWQVRTSNGALDCLTQLRQHLPQLLILDGQLPWGGAEGLLAVMRDDPSLARIPVILTTTEAAPEAESGSAPPPVVQTLWKPFSLAVLLELVRSELENGQPGWKMEGTHPAGVCS